ncbi:BatD family protein [Urechidicola vernalis]|uniref:BatD family protein n=1 Tax=Urechidicola vernalis TaxID=3075600 RepID=A0ABU2Y7T0_9FLAO|nr:BatD family protein [Urechidicola sp. P050]MDT0553757.1 BatD family protein [Urechidicola sp. P050]
MRIKHFYIVIFLFVSATVFGQNEVEFITTVSKSELGVHQRFRLEFTVNKQGADDFELPDMEDFEVLAGPSSSINQSWINGKASYEQSYIFILKPKKVGTFIIQPGTIDYKGKRIKSNSVQIKVLPESEVPKDPNDPYYIASQNLHLTAEISNERPYVGEGIYVVYKLYFSHNIGFSNWQIKDVPQYNGFWNQDIEVKKPEVQNTTYKGEKYRYIILKRALLIPQKSGKLDIDPINMDIAVAVPTGRGDFFGNAITQRVNYSTSSGKRKVNVQDLPYENRPADFSGAVGEFDFLVSASKDILRANETTQLEVKVSGKGNLKLFELPKIETPEELEVYTPEHKESVKTTLTGLSGKITDTYTIVPEFKGKYKIPEVSFTYFSLKEKAYRTITNQPIIIDVTEGKTQPNASVNDEAVTPGKQVVMATDKNFRFIQYRTNFEPVLKEVFFKSNLFYLLLFLPFIAIPIGIFIGKKKAQRDGDVVGKRLRKADKLAKKYLSQAKKQLGKKEAFYISLEKALHNYLKATLNIETSDISKEKISAILQGRKVDIETIKEFIAVLNDCDFARYTPTTDTMMKEEYNKAKMVIAKIDKQI